MDAGRVVDALLVLDPGRPLLRLQLRGADVLGEQVVRRALGHGAVGEDEGAFGFGDQVFDDLYVAVDVPDGDARGEGRDDLDRPAGQADDPAGGACLVGLLGVDRAGGGHLEDGRRFLRRCAVDDVAEVVDDGDEGQAEPASELQQALEELGDEGGVDDVPGLFDQEDALLAVGPDPGVLQPDADDRHQDRHRDRVAVDVREVEDDQGRVEVDADGGRAVEHAAQVTVDEPVQDEGDVQAPGPYIVYVDVHRLGGLGLRGGAAARRCPSGPAGGR